MVSVRTKQFEFKHLTADTCSRRYKDRKMKALLISTLISAGILLAIWLTNKISDRRPRKETDSADIKIDIGNIKTEMAGMKDDIGNIKDDMKLMNTDINNLAGQHKSDMDYIKNLDSSNGLPPEE